MRSTRFLLNPLFFSWTGIPVKFWPNTEKKQKQELSPFPVIYKSHPPDGKTSLVSDVGNLFQHLFYNGEVHLYDDEIDDRNGQIMIQVALRVHQTYSSLCAARYLNDKLLHDFFNINQYSLEVIRLINDQPCPYFEYYPIEVRGSRIDEIVVDDTPSDKCISWDHGTFYEYKPYE
ncbi:unnamed protein product [Rotaria sp. Silwood2]|nr:unnamed protein product [Rotaria sp. Silwood2]CAF3140945.1 unnamed protein product [Rotaria sp. Silwood2]CAF4201579.1 unnamed protein product [Rotaria sp. Silwood2]CAF4470463.1 unnamed protein product [Rotaria sp. Silwood2]